MVGNGDNGRSEAKPEGKSDERERRSIYREIEGKCDWLDVKGVRVQTLGQQTFEPITDRGQPPSLRSRIFHSQGLKLRRRAMPILKWRTREIQLHASGEAV